MIQTFSSNSKRWKSNKELCKLNKNSEKIYKELSVCKLFSSIYNFYFNYRRLKLFSWARIRYDLSRISWVTRIKIFTLGLQICHRQDFQYQKCNGTSEVYEQSCTRYRFLKELTSFRTGLETAQLRTSKYYHFSKNNEIYQRTSSVSSRSCHWSSSHAFQKKQDSQP